MFAQLLSDEEKRWAMILHFCQFAGLLIPFEVNEVKKKELPAIDSHGKVVTN